jgi:hypothetical protein
MNISRLHSLFEQLQHLSLMLVLAVLRMSIRNLLCLLEQAVKDDSGQGITVYLPNSITSSLFLPYKTVCCLVEQRSTQLQTLSSIDTNVILMYFAVTLTASFGSGQLEQLGTFRVFVLLLLEI